MKIEIKQCHSTSYGPRTYFNATEADLTIAIAADFTTAGEKHTRRVAQDKYMRLRLEGDPHQYVGQVVDVLGEHEARVINIAGNGIYTLRHHHWLQGDVNQWVYDLLKRVKSEYPITKIISGGQTGVDIAGIVAAYVLNIDAKMFLPKGFKRRDENGTDYDSTENEIHRDVLNMANRIKAGPI